MKDQKKIKDTTKLLMTILDITMVEFGPISSLLLLGRERGREVGSVERKAERCEEAGCFHKVAGVSDVVAGGPHEMACCFHSEVNSCCLLTL